MKKISRSKIEIFLSCPRCFWLDFKHSIKRPEEFSGGWIGQKYDPILKKEFDLYRLHNQKPKEIPEKFSLFPNKEKLKTWRGRGIEFMHKNGFVIYGKIDDLLLDEEGKLVPFDFKVSLSQEFKIYESYQRQLEIYGYLLKKVGEPVSDQGMLYIVKVSIDLKNYINERRFCQIIKPLNLEIYDQIIDRMYQIIKNDKPPEPNENCIYCQWLEKVQKIL